MEQKVVAIVTVLKVSLKLVFSTPSQAFLLSPKYPGQECVSFQSLLSLFSQPENKKRGKEAVFFFLLMDKPLNPMSIWKQFFLWHPVFVIPHGAWKRCGQLS